MNRRLIILALVGGAAIATTLLRPAARPAPAAAPLPPAGKHRLLDLGATTCVPCKAMVPVLDELRAAHGDKLEVEFINIWEDHAAGERWRVAVMPTQVFLSPEGKELARHEGFMSTAAIVAQWRQVGLVLE